MNNAKVSIAMATYNGSKYIKKQLESVLNQTYSNIELIICDDSSTDNTIEIIKEFQNKYPIHLVVNEHNLGYVKNFEKAISLCTGDYIALADQDDIWMPNKIDTLVNSIGDDLCIHTDAYLIDGDDKVFSDSYSTYSSKLIKPDSLYDLAFNGCVTGCTCMFKKELLKDILPFPEKLDVHDRWIGAVAYSKNGLKYLNKSLIKYRQHGSNNIGTHQVDSNFLLLVFKYLVRKKTSIMKPNKKFYNILSRKYEFVNIVIKRLNFQLTSFQLLNLQQILNIYSCFLEGDRKLVNFVYYLKYFSVIEKGKPILYKLSYFIIFFRDLMLIKTLK